MRGICIPCYEVLADVIPEAEKLRERSKLGSPAENFKKRQCQIPARYNATKWEEMAEEQKRIREAAETAAIEAAKKEDDGLGNGD